MPPRAAAISNGGALTVTATTISQNSALYGGGIASVVAPRLVDTIVAANTLTSSSGSGPDIHGSVLAASSYNLIGNGTGLSGISNGLNQNQVGTAGTPINPELDPLGNYGGFTQTMPFRTGQSRGGQGGRRHHADRQHQRDGHGHPGRRRRGLRQHQHPGGHSHQ